MDQEFDKNLSVVFFNITCEIFSSIVLCKKTVLKKGDYATD